MKFIPQIRSTQLPAVTSWFCLYLIAVPLVAQPASIIGTWCEIGGGEIIYLEEQGIGFNEHTLCIGTDPLTPVQSYQTLLSCKNIYFVDGVSIEAFQQSRMFSVNLSADDQLQVKLDDQSAPRDFARCEP